MDIYPGHDADKRIHYFEVDNGLFSRMAACRLVESIPGCVIVKRPARFDWFGDEVFCVFRLGDKTFQIWEPFGDNSRYHIGETPIRWSPELDIIRRAFVRHRQGWNIGKRIWFYALFLAVVLTFAFFGDKAGWRCASLIAFAQAVRSIKAKKIGYGWDGFPPSGYLEGAPAVLFGVLAMLIALAFFFFPEATIMRLSRQG